MHFDEFFLKQTLKNVTIIGALPKEPQVSIDSRQVKPGDIFVALKGEKVDGHSFIEDALSRGAIGVLLAHDKRDLLTHFVHKKYCAILVPDPLDAIFALATAWRSFFTYPIIGITGSVGKTTTKETLGAILELHGMNCLVSSENQNTQLGLALNLLKLRKHHHIAIFEVGINKRGEMAKLADMLRPTSAVITSIGHSHMEGLGSLADIAFEKREIFKNFAEHNIGFINGDQSILANVSYQHPVMKFGTKTTNQIQARKIRVINSHTRFILKIYRKKSVVTLNHPHAATVNNILAASAVAQYFGASQETIIKSIETPRIIPGRFEQRPLRTYPGILINDCYNANPESMKASLIALGNLQIKAKKIAVIGDMLELGINSPFWHRQIGRFLTKIPTVRKVILVGSLVQWTKVKLPYGTQVDIVPSWNDAAQKLKERLKEQEEFSSVVLVKGSHGMELQKLVDQFS